MRRDDGYTLLELLVAISLLALIAIPISASVSLGLKSWQKVHAQADVQERRALIGNQIGRWLAASYPFDVERSDSNTRMPMSGLPNEVSFVAPLSPNPLDNTLYQMRLALESTTGQLILEAAPDKNREELQSVTTKHTLLTALRTVRFSYLEAASAEVPRTWLASWQERRGLPVAVKYEMEFESGEERVLSKVIPLAVGYRAFCQFDEVSRECRRGGTVD